jgi:hypothetical protein
VYCVAAVCEATSGDFWRYKVILDNFGRFEEKLFPVSSEKSRNTSTRTEGTYLFWEILGDFFGVLTRKNCGPSLS